MPASSCRAAFRSWTAPPSGRARLLAPSAAAGRVRTVRHRHSGRLRLRTRRSAMQRLSLFAAAASLLALARRPALAQTPPAPQITPGGADIQIVIKGGAERRLADRRAALERAGHRGAPGQGDGPVHRHAPVRPRVRRRLRGGRPGALSLRRRIPGPDDARRGRPLARHRRGGSGRHARRGLRRPGRPSRRASGTSSRASSSWAGVTRAAPPTSTASRTPWRTTSSSTSPGKAGAFLSTILFVAEQAGTKEIVAMDFDGRNVAAADVAQVDRRSTRREPPARSSTPPTCASIRRSGR